VKVPVEKVRELREQSGAGVMDCRRALMKTEGDAAKALELLKAEGLLLAEKKAERAVSQGTIESYIHCGGHVGAMVEVNCETDFVARTEEFKELAHSLAMQIAAMEPQCVAQDDLPKDADADPKEACLLLQPYIKDSTKSIKDVIIETIAKVGENIKVARFARFELGGD